MQIRFLITAILFFIPLNIFSQTIEIVTNNARQNSFYTFFAEFKTDTSSSILYDGADYLFPNVKNSIIPLFNCKLIDNSFIAEFNIPDTVTAKYIKGGLVVTDSTSKLYSAMTVSAWIPISIFSTIPTDTTINDDYVYQNFPNPFNSTTTIRYVLKDDSELLLSIYNILGEMIFNKHAAEKKGVHQIVLDMSRFSSGNYFYCILINNKMLKIQKMTLIK